MAAYYLKEDNEFYGRMGSYLPETIYSELPESHQKLFLNHEDYIKYKSSLKLAELEKLGNSIRTKNPRLADTVRLEDYLDAVPFVPFREPF